MDEHSDEAGDAYLVRDAPQFLSDRHLAGRQYREDVVTYYRMAGPCAGDASSL
uniref:Uncharacterized protein n=1 Tax=Streptomyces sp. NBC_00119 TaxID=2975659 RepID=A0AAU1TX72_9ACTN